jgi:hypothetical protein
MRVRCTTCQRGRPEDVSQAEAEAWRTYHTAIFPDHEVVIEDEDG